MRAESDVSWEKRIFNQIGTSVVELFGELESKGYL